MNKKLISHLKRKINPHKEPSKEWFLSLLSEEEQRLCEEGHLSDLLNLLKALYLAPHREKIAGARAELYALRQKEGYSAEDFRASLEWNALIKSETELLNGYKCFFVEPYFARMDVVDEKEGYNSYYIGKKGDVHLEIVDWRAPLAVRYYQKSRVQFSINDYHYKTVLRRALSVKNGALVDFKNEYLSVREYLSAEEIAGRDEEILFDPFLRQIIKSRKDDTRIRDIIETIQEKQFDVITRPERESFVLQGCAGSGKTMILLHRLSYLMYNNEQLRPRDVLVITPSHSFNAFIDELSQVLELQKVKTVTLLDYYYQVLKNEGIDLKERTGTEGEKEGYLAYLYSPKFTADCKKQLRRIFDGIYGMFTSEECREVSEQILVDFQRMHALYDKVKNTSVRVRRAVLGEMKENKEGQFYYTKQFRTLMSAIIQAEDFFSYVLREEARTPDYFLRQFVEFYHGMQYIFRHGNSVIESALSDLATLSEGVEKEIVNLRRYRQKRGDEEILTYADRIARRQELQREIEKTSGMIADMGGGRTLFEEFFSVLKSSSYCVKAGRCATSVDIVRWLYRETVKKQKLKWGMKGIYPSDSYAICRVLLEAGRKLTPRYGLVFIDEGQDISAEEYGLLKSIHTDAAFNIFGDLKQNITPFRGVQDWAQAVNGEVYVLTRNYRNTNQIVEYVSHVLEVEMAPIGFDGVEVISLPMRKLNSFFKDKQGLKAVICGEEFFHKFEKRGYHFVRKDGRLSKSKINVMTVYESKGLEFSAVAVYDVGMTGNEKYIAYTRALRELAVIEEVK